ncbi:MAG: hypothetical protein ABSE08_16010, partial [Syntrophobacteraceae bacterium]
RKPWEHKLPPFCAFTRNNRQIMPQNIQRSIIYFVTYSGKLGGLSMSLSWQLFQRSITHSGRVI